MPDPFHDVPFEELRAFAQKLEESLAELNKKLLAVAGVPEGGLIPLLTDAAGTLLRLDEFSRKRLARAVEEARVHTLAGEGIALASVLTAAVALTEFRRAPVQIGPVPGILVGKVLGKGTKALRALSGLPPAVPALAVAMVYLVAGKQARARWKDKKSGPKTVDV